MVHSKFIRRGDKVFGPYYYENKRVDGKVVTSYVGKDETPKKVGSVKKVLYFHIILAVLFLLVLLTYSYFTPTGHVIIGLDSKYAPGTNLTGTVSLVFQTGELIPADSFVRISLGDFVKDFNISDLNLGIENGTGNYYAIGTDLGGFGEGYGVKGRASLTPQVKFTLKVSNSDGSPITAVENLSQSENNSSQSMNDGSNINTSTSIDSSSSSSTSTSSDSNDANVQTPVDTSVPTDVSSEPSSNSDAVSSDTSTTTSTDTTSTSTSSSASSDSSSASSDSSSSSSGGDSSISGQVVAENEYEIQGVVIKGSDFEYTIEPGQVVSLVPGSVIVDDSQNLDSLVSVNVDGNKVIVKTDYQVDSEGYGEEFKGFTKHKFEFSIDQYNITAVDGDFDARLITQSKELASASQGISVSSKYKNTSLRIIGNISTLRIPFGSSGSLKLNSYFDNADEYSFEGSHVSYEILNGVMVLVPEEGFRGATKGRIIAKSGNQSIESNEFLILVSSGAVNVVTSREKIVVGQAVKWVKNVSLESNENITITLPVSAENVSVNEVQGEKVVDSNLPTITAAVVKGNVWPYFFTRVYSGITGNAIDSNEENVSVNEKQVELSGNSNDYTVEYYTPAPTSQERDIRNGKQVIISGPNDVEYTDVIASANLGNSIPVSSKGIVKIYWITNESSSVKNVSSIPDSEVVDSSVGGSVSLNKLDTSFEKRIEVPFDAYDIDEDGNIDYIEWVVPHLSEQKFEIIYISNALELNENRSIVRDVYEFVKSQDNKFVSIASGRYLRVGFEKDLTLGKDITIYARGNNSRVLVYGKDSNESLGSFDSVGDYGKYKIYPNFNGSQGTFDLLSVGDVEYDYVVDPTDVNAPVLNFTGSTPTDGSTVNVNNFVVNVSSSDASEHYVALDFDNSILSFLRFDDYSGSTFLDLVGRNNATFYNSSGNCSGTPTNIQCSQFNSQSSCSSYNSHNSRCSWSTNCSGTVDCSTTPDNPDWCAACGGDDFWGSGDYYSCYVPIGNVVQGCESKTTSTTCSNTPNCVWGGYCNGNLSCGNLITGVSCTEVGGCTWPLANLSTGAGKFNLSALFNSSDTINYLNLPYSVKLSNRSEWSLSAWINTSGKANNTLYSDSYNSSKAFVIFVGDTEANKEIRIWNNGQNVYTYGTSFPAGVWTHVVLTYNGTVISYYRDGSLIDGQNVNINDSTGDSVFVGKYNSSLFNGGIDEFIIYNRTLGLNEVKSLYSGNNQFYNLFNLLSEGLHRLKAYAIDIFGNYNSTAVRSVTVDTPTPTLIVNSPSTYVNSSHTILFNVTLDADGSSVWFTITGGSINFTMSSIDTRNYNYTLNNVSDGVYLTEFYVDFKDGNKNYTAKKPIHVSLNPPSIAFVSPTPSDNSDIASNIVLNASVSDDNASVYAYYVTGLLNWYRFDNDAIVGENNNFIFDWSNKLNNGTIIGGPTINMRTGKFGGYFNFDGIDDTIMNNYPSEYSVGSYTILAWIKGDGMDNGNRKIFSASNGTAGYYMGVSYINLECGSSLDGINYTNGNSVFSDSYISDTAWHLVGCSRDRLNGKFNWYVDGVKVQSVNITSSDAYSNINSVYYGSNSGTDEFFIGGMDDMAVFNRQLEDQEVAAAFNATGYVSRTANDLIALNRMYFKAVDSSGNLAEIYRTYKAPDVPQSNASTGGSLIKETLLGGMQCFDSDGGRNYFKFGKTSAVMDDSVQSYSDRCLNRDVLYEYSCSGGQVVEDTYDCQGWCYTGSCNIPASERFKDEKAKSLFVPMSERARLGLENADSTGIGESNVYAEESKVCGIYSRESPKQAFASTTFTGYAASNVIDNNLDSNWYGSFDENYPKWVLVDLNEHKCVRALDVYANVWDLPMQFDVQVSNDGQSWNTVVKNYTIKTQRAIGVAFPKAVVARYLRLQETSSGRNFGNLQEIKVLDANYTGKEVFVEGFLKSFVKK